MNHAAQNQFVSAYQNIQSANNAPEAPPLLDTIKARLEVLHKTVSDLHEIANG